MEVQVTGDRRSRKRAETRARMISAARRVFARQGINETAINQITEEADVGFGSFYNYFDGKEAIVAAVLEQVAAEAGIAIDRATADIDDPAEVVSVAHRSLVDLGASDREWGWMLVRLDMTNDIARSSLVGFAARDLDRGIEAGRFEVADRNIALIASGGALVAVMRATLDGQLPENAAVNHAAGVLRMFGLPLAEALEVASRPLPV